MSQHVVKNPRVRFAPSPTGNLHLGGLRAAIFNWLFARHYDGKFVIRIEDTDRERSTKEYLDSIIHSLEWMNIKSDEPLHIQSEYDDRHRKYIQKLLDEGKAYKCFCSEIDLQSRCGDDYTKYDLCCRDKECHNLDDRAYVVRFKIPDTCKEVTFDDLIRGPITIHKDQLDDFIIARSDGSPIYNFVVVVDDAEMNINYVIRGEEHIGNTPKQILLYEALGLKQPQWAHVPLILSPDGGKLSKRDGAVSVIDYKKEGYLPDALFNYLVRLGWSHGDDEILSREQLIELFTLEGVGKSGAVFDRTKLDWVNSVYLKEMSASDIITYINNELDIAFSNEATKDQLQSLVGLYKGRVKTVVELVSEINLVLAGPNTYDPDAVQQHITPTIKELLPSLVQTLDTIKEWSLDEIKATVKEFCKANDLKLGMIAQPIRIALVGKTESPGVFDLMSILGKKIVRSRIEAL